MFWVMFAFAAACWILVALLLPETFRPVLLMRKAQRLRAEGDAKAWAPQERLDWSAGSVAKRTLMRPFQILFMEPILVLITIYLSIVYGEHETSATLLLCLTLLHPSGLLYSLFESVPIIFSDIRGFNLGQTGLCFIPVLIGTTLGAGVTMALGRKYEVLEKVSRASLLASRSKLTRLSPYDRSGRTQCLRRRDSLVASLLLHVSFWVFSCSASVETTNRCTGS